MKITKEIVKIPVAKLEESIKIVLTAFILNVDEIGRQEWASQKCWQIVTKCHVRLLGIEYPVQQGEKLINCITMISVARETLTGLFVIYRNGIENAI